MGGGVDGGGVEAAEEVEAYEAPPGLDGFSLGLEFCRGNRGIGSFVCTGVADKAKVQDTA